MIENLYIHIPFCKNICSYCDFSKMYLNDKLINDYLNALEYEIKNKYKQEKVKTIYIGGGTPSALSIQQLQKLFNILEIINKENIQEYTIECNIEDIEIDKLELFKKNNINRISIGLQTLNKNILQIMNRNYELNIQEKLNLAKKYFLNINIDLIYGLSDDLNILKKDLDFIISNDIPHVSTYSLILEKNTKLYNDKFKRIDDDKDYEMYKFICDYLKRNNYLHYEISNFSKKGLESKHNLCYWNNKNYYGFGLGSSGYINNTRYTNTRSINNYINKNIVIYEETLNKKETEEYEMILGLRKVKGVSKIEFKNKFNEDIEKVFNIQEMINKKLLEDKNDHIFIPYDKLYIENSILINFVGGSNE